MLKKNLLKAVVVMGISAIVLSNATNYANADSMNTEKHEVLLRYGDIVYSSITFDISHGEANMGIEVKGKSYTNIYTKIVLQKKQGSSWVTIDSFEKTNSGTFQEHFETVTLQSHGKYRVKYKIKVGNEEMIRYSSVKSY